MIEDSFVATTLFGLEEVLAGELREQGAENISVFHRAVRFSGRQALIYKLNLTLRTAIRMLMNIKSFTARDEEQFYNEVYKIDWNLYFPSRTVLCSQQCREFEIFFTQSLYFPESQRCHCR